MSDRPRCCHGHFLAAGQAPKKCKACQRLQHRRWKAKLKADPERYRIWLAGRRAVSRGYRRSPRGKEVREKWFADLRADPERFAAWKATQRAHYDRIKADRERYAQLLGDRRIQRRLAAERQGKPLPPSRPARSNGKGWTVDPEPIAAVIRFWLTAHAASYSTLARVSGVPERRIYGALRGERVSVPIADKLAVAMGTHLDVVYQS